VRYAEHAKGGDAEIIRRRHSPLTKGLKKQDNAQFWSEQNLALINFA
jgi:hypothetical protein